MNKETVELNLVNASALGIGMMPLDKVLTLLVLGTALIYNILKIYSWYKNRKNGKGKIY